VALAHVSQRVRRIAVNSLTALCWRIATLSRQLSAEFDRGFTAKNLPSTSPCSSAGCESNRTERVPRIENDRPSCGQPHDRMIRRSGRSLSAAAAMRAPHSDTPNLTACPQSI